MILSKDFNKSNEEKGYYDYFLSFLYKGSSPVFLDILAS